MEASVLDANARFCPEFAGDTVRHGHGLSSDKPKLVRYLSREWFYLTGPV